VGFHANHLEIVFHVVN
jgi:hypothetical protein